MKNQHQSITKKQIKAKTNKNTKNQRNRQLFVAESYAFEENIQC